MATNQWANESGALAPLINVQSGAEGDKLTPNFTKMAMGAHIVTWWVQ